MFFSMRATPAPLEAPCGKICTANPHLLSGLSVTCGLVGQIEGPRKAGLLSTGRVRRNVNEEGQEGKESDRLKQRVQACLLCMRLVATLKSYQAPSFLSIRSWLSFMQFMLFVTRKPWTGSRSMPTHTHINTARLYLITV